MNSHNIIVVESKTSIHDTVEKINNVFEKEGDKLILEIHSSLRCVSKAISIVEIVRRTNSFINVDIKNSNFLSNGAIGSERRSNANVIIRLERS